MLTITPHKTRPRRSRRVAALSLSILAGVALVGCGGDDDSTAKSLSTTTSTTEAASDAAATIGDDAVTDLGISPDEGLCFGNELVDQLGEDEALALNESEEDISELSEAQVTAVQVALNECVPGSAMAEDVTVEFYSSIGASTEPDAAVIECVADALDGRTGDVVIEGMSVDTTESDLTITTDVLEGCIPGEVVTELFVTSFTSAGLTQEMAQCAADQVAGQISLSQLVALGDSTGDLPPEIQAISDAAVEACI